MQILRNRVAELDFSAQRLWDNPIRDVALDVLFTDPDGETRLVPAFWRGGDRFSVRYSSPKGGSHSFVTRCSDESCALHGVRGSVEVVEGDEQNPLYRHGRLRVTEDRRHFCQEDGTPFFWLGDTWWFSLCKRLGFPGEFQELMDDRLKKGFTVVQLIAGLYPDAPSFDERGANEAGFPWDENFTCINPAYFDEADRRIAALAEGGLMPCIFGCWGYFLDFAGVDALKAHWRYLVARYAAYPVVFSAAGEAVMPFYGDPTWPEEKNRRYARINSDPEAMAAYEKDARAAWTDITAFIRKTDPFHTLVTIHPTRCGHDQVDDPSVLDFDMLQAGHGGIRDIAGMVRNIEKGYAVRPPFPVLVDEVSYEGIGGACHADAQRSIFYASLLSGSAGYQYGANGLWQLNREGAPFGPSPHGMTWGDTTWREAMRLPGSGQLGLGKSILEGVDWMRLSPRPEWAGPHGEKEPPYRVFAASAGESARVYFIPFTYCFSRLSLPLDGAYEAELIDTVGGKRFACGVARPDGEGQWSVGVPGLRFLPVYSDLLLVLRRLP